jgi:branched-chain amino acid transport system permease protein
MFGIALILIMRYRPQGIVPDAHRRAELVEDAEPPPVYDADDPPGPASSSKAVVS